MPIYGPYRGHSSRTPSGGGYAVPLWESGDDEQEVPVRLSRSGKPIVYRASHNTPKTGAYTFDELASAVRAFLSTRLR
jgi:hypothetical protein